MKPKRYPFNHVIPIISFIALVIALVMPLTGLCADAVFVGRHLLIQAPGWDIKPVGEAQCLFVMKRGGVSVTVADYGGDFADGMYIIEYADGADARICMTGLAESGGRVYRVCAEALSSYGRDELSAAYAEAVASFRKAPDISVVSAAMPMPERGRVNGYAQRSAGSLPLALPDMTHMTTARRVTFTAQTLPNADILVSSGGVPLSYAKANGEGKAAFSVELPTAEPIQIITVFASLAAKSAQIDATVLCAAEKLPLALLYAQAEVDTGSFDLYAYTLPRASITLTTPFSSMHAVANESGFVYFKLSIRAGARNTYAATATLSGYGDAITETVVTRGDSYAEDMAKFRSGVSQFDYKRAKDNLSAYSGRKVELKGRIEKVMSSNGIPSLIVNVSNIRQGEWGDPVCVVAPFLLRYKTGDIVTVLGTTLDSSYKLNGAAVPLIRAEYIN